MTKQEYPSFTVYPTAAEIPRYQRAWVWGLGALAILLCGVAAGWLFGSLAAHSFAGAWSDGGRRVDETALLRRQETVNRRLRERIAEMEQALAGDPCAPAALQALTRGAKNE